MLVCTVCMRPAVACCSKCREVYYCGQQCQRRDLEAHATVCGLFDFWWGQYTVADRIAKKKYLSALNKLLVERGLNSTLSDRSKAYTVFAPTNEAFERATEMLAKLTPEQVTEVLLFHVYSGNLRASSVVDLGKSNTRLLMMNGQRTELETRGGRVYVDEALVTKPDLIAANGVVHIIDAVMVPPAWTSM